MKTIKPTQYFRIVVTFIFAQYFSSCSNTKDLACPDFNKPAKHAKWYDTGLFVKNKSENKIKTTQSINITPQPKNQTKDIIVPEINLEEETIKKPEEWYASSAKIISVSQKMFKKVIPRKRLKTDYPIGINKIEKTKNYPPYPKIIQKPEFEISETLAVVMAGAGFLAGIIGLIFGLGGSVGMMFLFGSVIGIPLCIAALWNHSDNGYVLGFASAGLTLGFIYTLSYFVTINILTKSGAQGIFWTVGALYLLWAIIKGM